MDRPFICASVAAAAAADSVDVDDAAAVDEDAGLHHSLSLFLCCLAGQFYILKFLEIV